jgi:hypothetical protein
MRAVIGLFVALTLAAPAAAQSPSPTRGTVFSSDAGSVVAEGSVSLGTYAMTRLFWDLARENGAPDYEPDKLFAEAALTAGLSFTRRLPGSELYGGVSVAGARTIGVDPFDNRNQGSLRPERLFGGWRSTRTSGPNIDVSFGSQEYWIGTIAGGVPDGFLVRMGAGNGFEWGGQLLMPRKAWELAAVAKLTAGRWRAEGFWLRPNELPSAETKDELAGLKVEGSWSQGRSRAGAVFLGVPRSQQIYPRADKPGDFYVGGRDGLRTLHVYGYVTPLPTRVPTLTTRVEMAVQRNPRIDMRAGALYAEAAYVFAKARWTPTLSYTYAAFSGDDPTTSRYERFDPLNYGGSLYGTWFGANSSWALLNSNFNVHRVSAQFVATQADFVTVQYNAFRASELRSPIQFGQGTRFRCGEGGCGLLTGVVEPELSQDVYAGWTHLFGPRVNITVFGVTSVPGAGLTLLGATRWNTLATTMGWTF